MNFPKASIVRVGNDKRPYTEVEICGTKIIALLDSGAECTVVGKDFKALLGNSITYKPNPENIILKTADGTAFPISEVVELPIWYNGKCKVITAQIAPSISRNLILGIDFWKSFNIRPVICNVVESEKAINLSNNHQLSEEHATSLQAILKTMPFSKDGPLSKTSLLKHNIDTGDAKPIKQPQYSISPYVQKDVFEEIDRLLAIGAIHRCRLSGWNNPMVAVRKPSGKIRLCIDARKLNSVTVKDAYPQPQIARILAQLTGTKVLSSIDFSDAFLQVELDEVSQAKTAFTISGKGYFAYNRMPFGLCNSGATLCRLVDQVIGCDLEPNVFVYLDDVIIATTTFEQHFIILREIAIRLKAAGLTISSEKSRFCMKSLKYLGYIIGEDGIHPDPEKTESIHNYPVPKNVRDVRRLTGLAGWYRRFIPNFATITAPLTDMTKKGRKFAWTDEAQKALDQIKKDIDIRTCAR